MGLPMTINTANDSQWRLTISGVPSYPFSKIDLNYKRIDDSIFNNYYASITLPDVNVEYNTDSLNGFDRLFPKSHINGYPDFQIEFKAVETMENYLRFFFWAMGLRFGYASTGNIWQTDSVIELVLLEYLDNQSRPIARMEFRNCAFKNLSNLTLRQGANEEKSFTVSLQPHEIRYEFIPQT